VKIDSRTNFSGSGVISASPRNILADRDSRSEYPVIQLPGDQNRLGSRTWCFDDTNVRVFQTGSRPLTVSYPSAIPTESPYGLRKSAVTTPNSGSTITVYGGFGSSVYAEFDPYQDSNRPSPNLAPFTEQNIDSVGEKDVIKIDMRFSGSVNRFSRALTTGVPGYKRETSNGVFYYNSKNGYEFDIVGPRDPVTGFRYYRPANHTNATYTAPNGYQRLTSPITTRATMFHEMSMDAVSLLSQLGTGGDDVINSYFTSSFASVGQPSNVFGGPSNFRFYATSSNLIKMSDYINAAFEVESIEIRVTGSLNKIFDGQFTGGYPFDAYTFFLIRQDGPNANVATAKNVSSSYRELVSYSTLLAWNKNNYFSGSFADSVGTRNLKIRYTASLDYFINKDNFAFSHEWGQDGQTAIGTSSIGFDCTLDLTPKIAPANIHQVSVGYLDRGGWWGGGSSNLPQPVLLATPGVTYDYSCEGVDPTGKSIPLVTQEVTATTARNPFDTVTLAARPSARTKFPFSGRKPGVLSVKTPGDFQIYNQSAEVVKTSYLLLPTDNLIFGINVNNTAPDFYTTDPEVYPQYSFSTGSYLSLPPQITSLVIKGRYVKDGEKYHTSLPQTLNTPAVHESLHYLNPVLDQHEVASINEYTGSVRSSWITGSMTVPRTGWPRSGSSELIEGDNTIRKVFGSVIDGTAGDMASLQRNIRIVDAAERYYDSFVPDPVEMWRATGYTPILVGSGTSQSLKDGLYLLKITPFSTNGSGGGSTYEIFFGNATGGTKYINDSWLHKYPFSSEFAGLQRRQRKLTYSIVYELDRGLVNQDIGFLTSSGYTDVLSYFSYPQRNSNVLSGIRRTSLDTSSTAYASIVGGLKQLPAEVSNRILFGIGDGPYGIHLPAERTRFMATLANVTLPLVTLQKPVGFKYGLINANPMPTSAVFRATHYGHLRDMLEQRQYAAITLESIQEKSQIFPATNSKSARIKKATRPKTESPTKFPIEIKFRTPVHENPTLLGSSKDPMSTQSCNLSIYATSSLPYFDDEVVRNRTYPSGTI